MRSYSDHIDNSVTFSKIDDLAAELKEHKKNCKRDISILYGISVFCLVTGIATIIQIAKLHG